MKKGVIYGIIAIVAFQVFANYQVEPSFPAKLPYEENNTESVASEFMDYMIIGNYQAAHSLMRSDLYVSPFVLWSVWSDIVGDQRLTYSSPGYYNGGEREVYSFPCSYPEGRILISIFEEQNMVVDYFFNPSFEEYENIYWSLIRDEHESKPEGFSKAWDYKRLLEMWDDIQLKTGGYISSYPPYESQLSFDYIEINFPTKFENGDYIIQVISPDGGFSIALNALSL